jgi:hypothetical protein
MKPLPHAYDLPPTTVMDCGQNPIIAATANRNAATVAATDHARDMAGLSDTAELAHE